MTSFKRTQRKYVQKAYRVRNWREYETGLRARGSLTVWLGLTDGTLANWNSPRPTRRKPGRQRKYSNHAIETTVTVGLVFGLASRQTEGFLRSLLTLLNLDNDVPDRLIRAWLYRLASRSGVQADWRKAHRALAGVRDARRLSCSRTTPSRRRSPWAVFGLASRQTPESGQRRARPQHDLEAQGEAGEGCFLREANREARPPPHRQQRSFSARRPVAHSAESRGLPQAAPRCG